MDKKNTMLLTVIAVATLLVAVVGATFAFFTASQNATGTTTVEATTKAVGSIAVTGTAALKLDLNENHMTQATAGADGVTYWASETGAPAENQEAGTVITSTIAVTDGDPDSVYSCTLKLAVTKTGEAASLQADDAKLVLTGLNGATIANGGEIDFTQIADEYTVTFEQNGNVASKDLVSAAVSFTNKATEQDYFAGKGFGLTISNSSINCTIAD